MDSFTEDFSTKVEELNTNLEKFLEKSNNAAGSRARKNAQEMKKMLQELRVSILTKQKDNKSKKKSGATETEAVTETTNNDNSNSDED